jgi:hypothetical protein
MLLSKPRRNRSVYASGAISSSPATAHRKVLSLFLAHDKRYDTVTRLVSQYQDECSLTAGGLEVPQLQGRAPAPMTAQKWSCEVGKYLRGYSKNKYSAPERSHQTFTRTSQYRKFPGRGFHKYLKQGQSLSRIWRTRPSESTKQRSAAQADFALVRQALSRTARRSHSLDRRKLPATQDPSPRLSWFGTAGLCKLPDQSDC